MTVAQRIGTFASRLEFTRLSQERQQAIEISMLYGISMALADHGQNDRVQQGLRSVYCSEGRCSVLGSALTTSALDAAALNAGLMTARSQTDTHPDTDGHIGCVVIPAVLAAAQSIGSRTEDVLSALAAGYEVAPALGRAAVRETTGRGFRGTSIYGVVAAAAACSRLLRLTEEQTAAAVSIAANFASGLTQCYREGTAEAVLQVANASRGGLEAALLAASGVTAASHTFEGENGFFAAFSGMRARSVGFDIWGIDSVVLKSAPGCAINQAPLATLLSLLARGTSAEDVETVVVRLCPAHAAYPGITAYGPFPSRQGAIMSCAFMLGVALENGALTMRDLLTRFGKDPIHARSHAIRVIPDPEIRVPFTCRLEVSLRSGERMVLNSPAPVRLFDIEASRELCRRVAREWPASLGFDRLETAVGAYTRRTGSLSTLFAAATIS